MTQDATVLGAAHGALHLLQGEGTMFQDRAEKLPAGWMVNVQADASMAWKAFVYCASAPESRPLFTVCRWSDRVGLFVQWADGSSSSVVTCTQLRPILDMVPSSIFAFAAVSLATVSTASWADTLH